jgi:uncharacterized alkaline shock family protein YloU
MIQGKTIISDEVFVEIVRSAVDHLDSVTLTLNEGSSLFSLAKRVTDKMVPQITVHKTDTVIDENGTVTKGHVSFELKIGVDYGSCIPDVVEELRQAIVKEVVSLTEFYVDSVDVIVARLYHGKTEEKAAPAPSGEVPPEETAETENEE